jgi:hypothetical protein
VWPFGVPDVDNPIAGMSAALCAAVAVLVTVVAVISGHRRRRHRHQMQQWADNNGWTFTPRPAVEWDSRLPGGNKNGVTETLSTVLHGRQVTVAEYSVTDASDGTSTNTHWYIVTAAVLHRPLPATRVEPRGHASRLRNKLFDPDETATGNPDFDRAFRIRTADPAGLRHWFSLPLVTAHLAGQVLPAWNVQGTELLRWQPGRLKPDDIPNHASKVLQLADLLDGH